MNIKLILSTTRPGKASEKVGNWALKELQRIDQENNYEIIDLSKIDLPFFDEVSSPMNGVYEHDHTKAWSKTISDSDGFIVVLAEYNGGYPAPIKNAIDYLYNEWVGKPITFIAYGSSGGRSSTKQLSEIVSRMKMNVLNETVHISKVWAAFNEDGSVVNELVEGSLTEVVKQMNEVI